VFQLLQSLCFVFLWEQISFINPMLTFLEGCISALTIPVLCFYGNKLALSTQCLLFRGLYFSSYNPFALFFTGTNSFTKSRCFVFLRVTY